MPQSKSILLELAADMESRDLHKTPLSFEQLESADEGT